ncbi:hypothetical protein HDU67_005857 [Dinochytrium kinnereticum]|nr:hypothetical protein HDU67_005857 [Dinochytrium kinnereticum]
MGESETTSPKGPKPNLPYFYKDKSNVLPKLIVEWLMPKMQRVIDLYVEQAKPSNLHGLKASQLVYHISFGGKLEVSAIPTPEHCLTVICYLLVLHFLKMIPPGISSSNNVHDLRYGTHFEQGWQPPFPLFWGKLTLDNWAVLKDGRHMIGVFLDRVSEGLGEEDLGAWEGVAAVMCFGHVMVEALMLHTPISNEYSILYRALATFHALQCIRPPKTTRERQTLSNHTTIRDILQDGGLTLRFFQNPHVPPSIQRVTTKSILTLLDEADETQDDQLGQSLINLMRMRNSEEYDAILKRLQRLQRFRAGLRKSGGLGKVDGGELGSPVVVPGVLGVPHTSVGKEGRSEDAAPRVVDERLTVTRTFEGSDDVRSVSQFQTIQEVPANIVISVDMGGAPKFDLNASGEGLESERDVGIEIEVDNTAATSRISSVQSLPQIERQSVLETLGHVSQNLSTLPTAETIIAPSISIKRILEEPDSSQKHPEPPKKPRIEPPTITSPQPTWMTTTALEAQQSLASLSISIFPSGVVAFHETPLKQGWHHAEVFRKDKLVVSEVMSEVKEVGNIPGEIVEVLKTVRRSRDMAVKFQKAVDGLARMVPS